MKSLAAIETLYEQSAREILHHVASRWGNNSVVVSSHSISWIFHFKQGKLVHASSSLEDFEILERQLRRISRDVPTLHDKLRSELRLMFAGEDEGIDGIPSGYRALSWLISEQYLPKTQASKVIARTIQEVLETFLVLPKQVWEVQPLGTTLAEVYCMADVDRVSDIVMRRLRSWQALGPTIVSPYQRLYLVSQTQAERHLPVETIQQLGRILRGFDFRQLGALLDRDDLRIAKQLFPLIRDGAIYLREPLSPFSQLPNTYCLDPQEEEEESLCELSQTLGVETDSDSPTIGQALQPKAQKVWKIACIDDSPAMLQEIERFLEGDEYVVHLISDSMRALMKLASIQPDLILMDVGMPNCDGYQLCSFIRKSSLLKDTPVVMVTGHKGLLDRARARLVGATDYLTKPFTQADLLQMVMRHLA